MAEVLGPNGLQYRGTNLNPIWVQDTAPANPQDGDLWFDTDDSGSPGGGVSKTGCRVYSSGFQDVPNGTFVTVAFDSEEFDTDNMHDTATNNSRVTINTAGVYVVSFSCELDQQSGDLYADIRRSVGGAIAVQAFRAATGFHTRLTLSTIWDFVAGDYIEVQLYQNSGGLCDLWLGELAAILVAS